MQFSPLSCHFIFKYSAKFPVLINTHNRRCTVNVKEQASPNYKTKLKVILEYFVCYIIIVFVFSF
jgi:hypothetical protein